jgi:hypothetical protein
LPRHRSLSVICFDHRPQRRRDGAHVGESVVVGIGMSVVIVVIVILAIAAWPSDS